MKVLFDLNVVLDLFLDRSPWVADAKTLVGHVLAGRIRGFVSASAVPTLFYIARKSVGTDRAFVTVQTCLATFEVLTVGQSALESASRMANRDFEDNVHVAAAVEAGLDTIVTRDPAGFAGAPLPVISPGDLVRNLAALPGSP
jgi:predicted nucleic acid-binding protein